MQVRPSVADQRRLHGEQHEVADEDDRMAMHDERVVKAVLGNVLEAVGPEARHHARPDERSEEEEGVAVGAGARRQADERCRCYDLSPIQTPDTPGAVGTRPGSCPVSGLAPEP
jgi:hypothetical protein